METPSMLNIANGVMGQRIPERSISMMNLLDEKSLDKIQRIQEHIFRNIRISERRYSSRIYCTAHQSSIQLYMDTT